MWRTVQDVYCLPFTVSVFAKYPRPLLLPYPGTRFSLRGNYLFLAPYCHIVYTDFPS